MSELSVKDKMTLDFAGQWFKYGGVKDHLTLATFSETPTRFNQRLNALLDRPEALAYNAQTVRRLQRLRAARAEARSWKRVG